MAYSRQACIGWDNVFARGELSASSEQAGGEKENAVDGFTFDFWRPAGAGPYYLTVDLGVGNSAAVDYLAIAAHNLGSIGADIRLAGSDDNVTYTQLGDHYFPSSNKPYLWRFASASYRYFNLMIAGDGAVVGVLQAGAITVLPEGVYVGSASPTLNRQDDLMNNVSDGGQFLGRSLVRSGATDAIKQERVADSWVRSVWAQFVEHARTRPFFWAWRQESHPDDVMYAWLPDNARPKVTQGAQEFSSVELSITGIV